MFSQRDKERYVVMDDYKGKDKDQLTVKKGEFVYLVSQQETRQELDVRVQHSRW